jgi:hypothetical protein
MEADAVACWRCRGVFGKPYFIVIALNRDSMKLWESGLWWGFGIMITKGERRSHL